LRVRPVLDLRPRRLLGRVLAVRALRDDALKVRCAGCVEQFDTGSGDVVEVHRRAARDDHLAQAALPLEQRQAPEAPSIQSASKA
jgi:hypothetical protein